MTLLRSTTVRATAAVSDVARARSFYEGQLGLEPLDDEDGPVVMYPCGESWLQVYQSDLAGKNEATVASWSVDDYDAVIAELLERGVEFERYDGLESDERGVHIFGEHHVAWCSDPDGNVLAIDNGKTGY